MRITVKQNEYSGLWYWRIYGDEPEGMQQMPLIASNGYAEEKECRRNLNLVRRAFAEERK